MKRSTAREEVLTLLFEHEFKKDEDAAMAVRLAEQSRDLVTDEYVERVYFGVLDNLEDIDVIISKRAIGWKTNRMSKVVLSILRLSTYEMKYCEDVPYSVAINEAVELSKKYDDEKAPGFVNGILNGIAEDLGLKNKESK